MVGFDPDPAARELALSLGAVDQATDSVGLACESADFIFCAAPVGRLPHLIGEALEASSAEAVLSDVGSTKYEVVSAVGGDGRFVGGHPLAGAETAGVANAREDLFEDARWFLTPTKCSDSTLYARLLSVIVALGARPQKIEADIHDRLMATVSALPHVLANVLAAEASGEFDAEHRTLDIGPSFRDATRVAGSNPGVWTDIFATNREAIANSLASLGTRLHEASELIRAGESDAIHRWHEAAGEDRLRLLKAGNPERALCELRIITANQPGGIAELAGALGSAEVNIEDMSVSPAPDHTSGAVSIWIAGESEAERGAELVRNLGHKVSVVGANG